jgi:hypothetical protein
MRDIIFLEGGRKVVEFEVSQVVPAGEKGKAQGSEGCERLGSGVKKF